MDERGLKMERIKKYIKQKRYGLMAFGIPFLIAVLICIGNRVFPFGPNSMLHIDMYHQYCPFFTEFAEKLKHGGSLLYTWNLGLGSDYISLYAYYLASPLNFLLILCPRAFVIEFMELTILFKIGLSGMMMYLYLRDHGRLNLLVSEKRNSLKRAALVFSTTYALSGFVAAYSWDIMWMDTVALAPLVILGLEKLVKDQKPALYTISLAIAIWSNYYIAIMLCIFLVCYFVWLFMTKAKGWKAKILATGRFGLYSLLAGGMSAILILPEIIVLGYSGSSMGDGFPSKMEWYFNVLAEFGRMNVATDIYTSTEHWPNLYCGAFTILLVILYAFNRKISWKNKLAAFAMVAFFMIGYANNYLDFFWHGFHFPESLPGRQSYLFAFLLLTMAFSAWRKRSYYNWQIFVAVAVALALLGLSYWNGKEEITPFWSYALTAMFFLLYLLLYLVRRSKGMKWFLMLVVFSEIAANMTATGIGVTSRVSYKQNDADYAYLLSVVRDREGDDFYRVEAPNRLTKNDCSYHSYPAATVFSSLMNIDVSHFYQSVYMEGGKNYYCYNGATPLTSAMLSVDYIITQNELAESPYWTLAEQSGNLYLYQATYSLSAGYVIDSEIPQMWDSAYPTTSDRINNLTELTELLGASDRYLRLCAHEEDREEGCTTIHIAEPGYYYASYFTNSNDRLTMSSSRGYQRTFSKASHRYLLELGACEAGDEIKISNAKGDILQFNLFSLNEETVQTAYETLAKEQLKVTGHSDTTLDGTLKTEGGQMIFSIPYVPGWKAYVDGKECELQPFEDAFLSLSLGSGTHDIHLEYHTPGLLTGAVISALCIAIFLLLLVGRRFFYAKENQHCDSVL